MKYINKLIGKYNIIVPFHNKETYIKNRLSSAKIDTLFINNLSDVVYKYNLWNKYFTGIRPFYSVKSNTDPVMISILRELGVGFDCASGYEIKKILSLGIKSHDIIFANPCKRRSDINVINKNNINLTTFDNENELLKIKKFMPHINCLLRVKIDDVSARCQLGSKYGAEKNEVTKLLKMASQLDINVIGTAFHVGSDAKNPNIFKNAVYLSHNIFVKAEKIGHNMKILNVGGGFKSNIPDISIALNSSINKYFPKSRNINIIAEPGRFFSESMSTLACKIIGKKKNNNTIKYWITDGLYGSMNSIIYDRAILKPTPILMKSRSSNSHIFNSIVFGPTCDSFDVILSNFPLIELQIDDWLIFPNMGAYSLASASSFNGFNPKKTQIDYIWTTD